MLAVLLVEEKEDFVFCQKQIIGKETIGFATFLSVLTSVERFCVPAASSSLGEHGSSLGL